MMCESPQRAYDYTLSASTLNDENKQYTTYSEINKLNELGSISNLNHYFTMSKPQEELADMLIRQIKAG